MPKQNLKIITKYHLIFSDSEKNVPALVLYGLRFKIFLSTQLDEPVGHHRVRQNPKTHVCKQSQPTASKDLLFT